MAVTTGHQPGVSLGREPSVLGERAVELLSRGPADSVAVVKGVCQMPAVAGALADHLATALLAGDSRFRRGDGGMWELVASSLAASTLSESAVGSGLKRRGKATAVVPAQAVPALSSTPFVVVDVETTGTGVYRGDRVTEVAVVRVMEGRADIVFDTLVNPERTIPPYVSKLTSITWDMVRDAPTFREVAFELAGVLDGHVFVAHNANFDWRFLSMEMERATGRPLIGRTLCTVKLTRKLVPLLRRRSLDHVTHHFGIDIESRHRAGGDARATAEVFLRLLKAAGQVGLNTLDDVDLLLRQRKRRKKRRRPSALPQPATDE